MKFFIIGLLFMSFGAFASPNNMALELLESEFYGRSLPPKHQVASCLDFSRFQNIKVSPNDVDYDLEPEDIIWVDEGFYRMTYFKVTEGALDNRSVGFQVKKEDGTWIDDSFEIKLESVDPKKYGGASILTPPRHLYISRKCFKP